MTDHTTPKKRPRSPNYPGIDVGAAIERASALWENEQHHPVAFEVALRHWGYQPKSGGGGSVHAALKRFGLLEDIGNGRSRLTPLALDIVRAEREGQRDYPNIRKAALMPKVHAALWDQYGATLPSDESLIFSLTGEMGFTRGGATEFVAEWKRTLAFAKLADSSASVSPDPPDNVPSPPLANHTVSPPTPALDKPPSPVDRGTPNDIRTIQVPYSPTGWALVQAPFPISEQAWSQMLAVLAAMKPGLVTAEDSTG